MISFIKKLVNTDFFKNLATMMTGTLIGQIITLATMPLLSRLYTPAEFGVYSLLITTITLLGYVSNGKYDNAIVLPTDDNEAKQLLALCLKITFFSSVIILIVEYLLPLKVYESLRITSLLPYRFFIPMGVFILGCSQAYTYWHNRNKNFKILASNKVYQSSATATINIGGGFLQTSTWGLFGGYLIGQVISLWLLVKKTPFKIINLKSDSLKNIAKKFNNFPIFLAPMVLLNTFSLNILVYMLTVFFDTTTVGLYSQAYKAIGYPLSFITIAFTNVFFQKLNTSSNKLNIYYKSFIISLVIGFFMLLPVMVWGKELFGFVFGKQWEMAGSIAVYICPLTIISFAVSNVSEVFSVTQRNHILLIWQIIYLALASFLIIHFKSEGIFTMLKWFTSCCATMYIILAFIGYQILKKHEKNILVHPSTGI